MPDTGLPACYLPPMPPTPQHKPSGRPSANPARQRPQALPEVDSRHSMQRSMLHVRGLNASLVELLWGNPDEVVAAAHMLKDGDRCTVGRLEPAYSAGTGEAAGEAAGPLTLKRYNLKGSLHTAIHMPMRSRAMWSWLNGRRLVSAGLPTPMPLACVEERQHRILRRRSFLLTTFIPGRSLLEVIESREVSNDQLVDLAKQFTRIWQTLGQLRAGHGDMKASNFIVDARGKLWLIDLDGLRIYSSAALLRRERRNDLVRFMLNWQERPEVAAIFRARIGTG